MAEWERADPSPEAAFREAEARIAAWRAGEPLDLAIDGLERIPESIGQLSGLTALRLRRLDDNGRWVGASRVSDLAPLAGLTALQRLDCSWTQVSDLAPLSSLIALQSLDCSYTEVSDLAPLADLTALQSLDCGDTQVSDLAPLSGLTALQSLDCGDTQVSDLAPLSGLTALKSLECALTEVSDLAPLSGLTALQSLECALTEVSDLAPLSGLTALQSLDCGDTQVSDLAPLSGLTALQSLDCGDTEVSDLAPLSGLTALQSLDCGDTQVSDLAPLSGLTALKKLNCVRTKVSDLAPLSGLTTLQSLECALTEVSDLAPLSSLTALQSLECSATQVSDLAPLSSLTALQSLTCWVTPVSDLAPLSGLTALQSLECNRCRITGFPDGLFDAPALEKVICHEGHLGDIPAEVLSQTLFDNCLPRVRAHLRDLENGAEHMRDAKMLVLGNGRVGKTQLCRRLLGEPFEDNAASTHGIVVRTVPLPGAPDDDPPRLQLWDFGGQDIYHSTHTLFMRSRGLYLVAWTPAMEDSETHTWQGHAFRNHTLPAWLDQVAEFGGRRVPLMVVQTQVDSLRDRRPLDATAREKAEGFETWFALDHSARTGRGQDDLREAISACYETIEQPLIGVVRARVKHHLEDLITTRAQRTMTVADFCDLCTKEGGVADPALFLETLHNNGTVFYRSGFFSDAIILDLEWAIRAIYAVFDRDSKTYAILKAQDGAFTRTLLGQVLWNEDYTTDEQDLFLSMMRSCGICFEKRPGDDDSGLEAAYIAPDLLPKTLNDGRWDGGDADQAQERHYAYLPGALIRGVICVIGQEAGIHGDYWRHGVRVIEARTRSEGLIESDAGAGRLTLRTRAGASAALLEALVKIVIREEDRLGLKPREVTGGPAARPRRQDMSRETPGAADGLDFTLPPRAEPAWFFSYATASEESAGQPVAAFCRTVRDKTGITVRRDVDKLRYGDEIEAFMRELAAGDRIIVWLTDAYLRSPFCMFELHEIWRRCKEDERAFEDRVTVVVGDACLRYETDLKRYRDFWCAQQEAAYDRLKRTKNPTTVAGDLARITAIVNTTDDILIFIRKRIRYQSFEALETAVPTHASGGCASGAPSDRAAGLPNGGRAR